MVAKGGDILDRPYIFRSYDHIDTSPLKDNLSHHFNPGPAHQTKLWEVARATSAAPRYFDKMVIGHEDFIDGGVGTNNPADRVRRDVNQILGDSPELIVSIGTGIPPAPDEGDRRKRMWLPRGLRRAKDFFSVVSKLAKIATESEETHDRLAERSSELRRRRAEDRSKEIDYPMYFRFNVPDITGIRLDEWRVSQGTNTTLDTLTTETEKYLNQPLVNRRLQDCAIELVRIRRERAGTERWESFATDTTYKCPDSICKDGEPAKHMSRDELRQHALIYHEYVAWATLNTIHLCTLDNCATKPVPVPKASDFLDHLKLHHGMHNPELKEPSDLENWLNRGISDGSSQQNGDLTWSSRRPSGGVTEPTCTQEGNATGPNDNSTTGSQYQQDLGPPAEQVAGAMSSSGLDDEATDPNTGYSTTSQQQQQQPQAPRPSAEHVAQPGPSKWHTIHTNSGTTSSQQNQGPSPSVEQTAGAEQGPEQNGNVRSPVVPGQPPSSRPGISSRFFPSMNRAGKNDFLRKVYSI